MMNSLNKDADGAVKSQAFGPLLYDDIKTSCNRRGINRSADSRPEFYVGQHSCDDDENSLTCGSP